MRPEATYYLLSISPAAVASRAISDLRIQIRLVQRTCGTVLKLLVYEVGLKLLMHSDLRV